MARSGQRHDGAVAGGSETMKENLINNKTMNCQMTSENTMFFFPFETVPLSKLDWSDQMP